MTPGSFMLMRTTDVRPPDITGTRVVADVLVIDVAVFALEPDGVEAVRPELVYRVGIVESAHRERSLTICQSLLELCLA